MKKHLAIATATATLLALVPISAHATPVIPVYRVSGPDDTQFISSEAFSLSELSSSEWIATDTTANGDERSFDDLFAVTTDSVWVADGATALLVKEAQTSIESSDLATTLRDASVDGGEGVEVVVVSQMVCDGPRLWQTVGGLRGMNTLWSDGSASMTTDRLVELLERNDGVVTGYGVSLAGPARVSAMSFAGEVTAFGRTAASEAYAAADSLPLSRATSTGVRVSGSGFDPDEAIELASIEQADDAAVSQSTTSSRTAIASQGTTVVPDPTSTLRAAASGWPTGLVTDASGAFAGSLVLPATLLQGPGTYAIALRGITSGKTAVLSLTLTADTPAPSSTSIPVAPSAVAVAVPARVSYTC